MKYLTLLTVVLNLIPIFFGGFVCALNLATMYPNPAYDANWLKVFVSVFLAVIFGINLFYREPN